MSTRKWEVSNLAETVIAVDLDGVLAEYPDHFVNWVYEAKLTKSEKRQYDRDLHFGEPMTVLPLHWLKNHLSFNRYRALKSEYRKGGYELMMPPTYGAKSFIEWAKGIATVVVITARPTEEYINCVTDTYDWLEKNGLRVDHVLFSANKHVEVLEKYPHTLFMVEDHRYLANLVARWGYPVFLIDTPYNEGDTLPGVLRAPTLQWIMNQPVSGKPDILQARHLGGGV